MERLDHHERKQEAEAARERGVKEAQRRVHEANERRRAAEGGR